MYVSPRANYRSASSTDSLIWVSVPLLCMHAECMQSLMVYHLDYVKSSDVWCLFSLQRINYKRDWQTARYASGTVAKTSN